MKIKIDYLKQITREIETKKNALAGTMDRFEVVANEEDITSLAEALRYFADLVESIPLA